MLYLLVYTKDGGPEQLKTLNKGPEAWEMEEILDEIGGEVEWDLYESQMVDSSDKLGLTNVGKWIE